MQTDNPPLSAIVPITAKEIVLAFIDRINAHDVDQNNRGQACGFCDSKLFPSGNLDYSNPKIAQIAGLTSVSVFAPS